MITSQVAPMTWLVTLRQHRRWVAVEQLPSEQGEGQLADDRQRPERQGLQEGEGQDDADEGVGRLVDGVEDLTQGQRLVAGALGAAIRRRNQRAQWRSQRFLLIGNSGRSTTIRTRSTTGERTFGLRFEWTSTPRRMAPGMLALDTVPTAANNRE